MHRNQDLLQCLWVVKGRKAPDKHFLIFRQYPGLSRHCVTWSFDMFIHHNLLHILVSKPSIVLFQPKPSLIYAFPFDMHGELPSIEGSDHASCSSFRSSQTEVKAKPIRFAKSSRVRYPPMSEYFCCHVWIVSNFLGEILPCSLE